MPTTESLSDHMNKEGRDKLNKGPDTLRDAVKNLEEKAAEGKESLLDLMESATDYMKLRPGRALVSAGAVGLVVGVLVARIFSRSRPDPITDRFNNAVQTGGKNWEHARDGFEQILTGVRALWSGRS